MAKQAEISFDGLSVEEILAIAEKAKTHANKIIVQNKQEGLDKIIQIIEDYHLIASDLKDIFSSAGSEESAIYQIEGAFWKAGIGKTPDYVIKFLKNGGKLRDCVYKERVTASQADEKEKKVRESETFKNYTG